MKKTGIVLMMMFMTLVCFDTTAQEGNSLRESKAQIFAQMAAEEFNLDKKQEQELFKMKLQHMADQNKAKDQFKRGEISKEDKNAPNRKFGGYFTKLTGKKFDELKPFYEKVNKAMWGDKK